MYSVLSGEGENTAGERKVSRLFSAYTKHEWRLIVRYTKDVLDSDTTPPKALIAHRGD